MSLPIALSRALELLPGDGAGVRSWRRAPAGLANQTWEVELDGGAQLAVQVEGDWARTRGADRASTLAVCRLAGACGVAPPVLVADAASGTLIQEWVSGTSPLNLARDLSKLVATLRRFHGLPLSLPERSASIWIGRYTADLTAESGLSLADALGPGLAALAERLLADLEHEPRALVPCHNDLVPENILVTSSRVVLIDFEWAGANEPLDDLAGLWVWSGEELDVLEELVDEYTGFVSPVERLRARRLALLRHVVDAVWHVLRGEDATASRERARALTHGI